MKGMFYISYLVVMLVLVVAAEIINFARKLSNVLIYEYNFICTCCNRSYVRSRWRNINDARFG